MITRWMSLRRQQKRKRRNPWRLTAALPAIMRLFMIRSLRVQAHGEVGSWSRAFTCARCTSALHDSSGKALRASSVAGGTARINYSAQRTLGNLMTLLVSEV